MNTHIRPRSVEETCTNGMITPREVIAAELLAAQLLLNLNSEGECHTVTDTVLRRWSSIERNSPVRDCNEVRLRKQDDGKYSIFIGYTSESGRFIDCHGYLGATAACISTYLQPQL